MTHVLVFLSALVFEGCYLAWMHCAARGHAKGAAVMSAIVGGLAFYGTNAAVHDPKELPFVLAGYAVGSYAIVRWTDSPRGGRNTG